MQENNNWIKIYSTDAPYKAEIIKALFLENEIECIEINKQDSMYGTFGEIEIYTQRDNVVKALYLLKEKQL